MNEELSALQLNNTWSITSLPNNKKPIMCKWAYKMKFNFDGSINRHKAKVVAKGFNQVEAIDFKKTFASVSKTTTLKTVFVIGVSRDWNVHQIDVQNAFLHGALDEVVSM